MVLSKDTKERMMILKKILLIATGGTIASKRTGAGLVPLLGSEDLLTYVPAIRSFCEVETLQILNIDSTNMQPVHWQLMAKSVAENYDRYDGFVICHGTDTLSYTAAALSYLIQDCPKPIVLTGSQKPIDMEITDAKTNLADSFLYAADNYSAGVSIVFGGKVIAGTRARKMRTKSYNAISSINFPNLAVIQDGRIIRYIKETGPKKKPAFYHEINEKVFLLKLTPGIDPAILDYLIDRYDGLVIESFGVGGIPDYEAAGFYERLQRWTARDKAVVIATQVLHEGSDMEIYHVGHHVKNNLGILEAFDMTLDSVVTKLMWSLGQSWDLATVRREFYREINHDILFHVEK